MSTDVFQYGGKSYRVRAKENPAVNIPTIGIRTAAEILVDKKAQAYLVKAGCVGTVLEEVSAAAVPATKNPYA